MAKLKLSSKTITLIDKNLQKLINGGADSCSVMICYPSTMSTHAICQPPLTASPVQCPDNTLLAGCDSIGYCPSIENSCDGNCV
jgi:hypothetical protein